MTAIIFYIFKRFKAELLINRRNYVVNIFHRKFLLIHNNRENNFKTLELRIETVFFLLLFKS